MERMENKIDDILKILNPHDDKLGLVAQVNVNTGDIKDIKKKPKSIRDNIMVVAIICTMGIALVGLFI